jgi:hypothetical protein
MTRKWKVRSHGGRCECGSTDDVIQYVHEDTGETRRLCVNCEDAAAAAQRVS